MPNVCHPAVPLQQSVVPPQQSAQLIVHVVTSGGINVRDAIVEIKLGGNKRGNKRADVSGYADFGDVEPGQYDIFAEKSNCGENTVTYDVKPFTSNQVRVELTPAERTQILYIDIEHLHLRDREAPAQEINKDTVVQRAREVVPAAQGRRIWYADLTDSDVEAAGVLALVISGNCSEWSWYNNPTETDSNGLMVGPTPSLDHLKKIITTTRVPICAVCGGHQLVAKAFMGDSAVDHVDYKKKRLHRDTEYDKTIAMNLTSDGMTDTIYNNLIPKPMFREFHHDEVIQRHSSTKVLASTNFTYYQSLKYERDGQLIYTSQFHPEQDQPTFTDGAVYLRNFFEIVKNHWRNNPC